MEQAVNGSGGELHRGALVDTKNQWTCTECGTVNTITVEDTDGVTLTMNACTECGVDKSVEVDLLRTSWQRKAESAKDAKKEYEIGGAALLNLINTFKLRRQQALNPSQPYLKDVSAEQPAPVSSSTCPWEREHPGQSCPICTAANAKDLVPALESEVHPEHEGHATIAEAARVKNVLEPLAEKLRHVHVIASVEDLQQLSTEDLTAITSYADEPTPMPPQLVARCCVAAEPGSIIQVCQRCERVLIEVVTEANALPVGEFVGFACEAYVPREDVRVVAGETEDPPSAEPVRTIKPRGSKKTAKKQPEQERAKQAEAGRKAAAKKPQRRHNDKPAKASKRKAKK